MEKKILEFAKISRNDWIEMSEYEKEIVMNNFRISDFFKTTSPIEYTQKLNENYNEELLLNTIRERNVNKLEKLLFEDNLDFNPNLLNSNDESAMTIAAKGKDYKMLRFLIKKCNGKIDSYQGTLQQKYNQIEPYTALEVADNLFYTFKKPNYPLKKMLLTTTKSLN